MADMDMKMRSSGYCNDNQQPQQWQDNMAQNTSNQQQANYQ